MTRTRKQQQQLPPPPAPATHSHSSDEDASLSEEEVDLNTSPPEAQTADHQKPHADESDKSESEAEAEAEAESDPEPRTKTPSAQPSESENDASDEEEEGEGEGEGDEESKSVPEADKAASEAEPLKKKVKVSDSTAAVKKSSIIQRIWSLEDEMELLRHLAEYNAAHGNLPPRKGYLDFLSGIKGSFGFNVTEMQRFNKIRHLRDSYCRKKKKGFQASSSNSHDREVYEICSNLFGSDKKSDKNVGKKSKKRVSKGSINRKNDGVGSDFFLKWLIEDFKRRCCPGLTLSAEDLIGMIGSSNVNSLDARAKFLKMETMKVQAMEKEIDAELMNMFLGILASK